MNKVFLVGRLTHDNEIRYTESGLAVASGTIAVNRRKKEQTDFINFVCFGKLAENVSNYTGKGSKVLIEGELNIDKYEKDGKTSYYTKVVANNVEFLDSKKATTNDNVGQKPQETSPFDFMGNEIDDKDLPF